MTKFSFTYTNPSGKYPLAKLGELNTPHGKVKTPAFIFCATKAVIKGLPAHYLADTDTQIILANTYHLLLQPGSELIAKAGGLHKFMGWGGPMLTDSGGFQIFSLGHGSVADEIKGRRSGRGNSLVKISEHGAQFRSYVDGKMHILTPEKAIITQVNLGPDLVVVLDECTPFHIDKYSTESSMRLSHRWALRSIAEFKKHDCGVQKLYGIVQGGIYADLRLESAHFINEQDFFGCAIGGSLGANKEQMHEIVRNTAVLLKPERPLHLLGIGGIADIFNGVKVGIDTFDCVHPTRLARHGGALVRPRDNAGKEHINLNNSRYKEDFSPIDAHCDCSTCKLYTKAYIHHLLKSKEFVAGILLTLHNIKIMNRLCLEIRQALDTDSLDDTYHAWF